VWVVVPVKPFTLAKRRLASVLTEAERAMLARAMLCDLLSLLAQCSRVSGVLCVTREPQVLELAAASDAEVLPEAQPGLSNSVAQAARHLAEQGHGAMLVLPTDIPLATSAEVDMVIAKHGWAPAATIVSMTRLSAGTPSNSVRRTWTRWVPTVSSATMTAYWSISCSAQAGGSSLSPTGAAGFGQPAMAGRSKAVSRAVLKVSSGD
jgi:2-phospho-L-lactate guanylyltransferase (CobY/MobA/RfbA family)